MSEQDRHAERHKAFMENDFPGIHPGSAPAIEYRMANAAEYSAYQLGQINRSLKKIVELLEKGAK